MDLTLSTDKLDICVGGMDENPTLRRLMLLLG